MNYSFQENEMPYGILERFGLTKEMIDDLPTDVLDNIYAGRRSPVLPVKIIADDGEEVKSRTCFSLIRTPDGDVDILFYPKFDEYDLKLFNEQQKQRMLSGKPVVGYLESNEQGNEKGTKSFFQIDSNSKQVFSVPTPVIGRNIQYISDRFHLTGGEIQKLQNGEVLSIIMEDKETGHKWHQKIFPSLAPKFKNRGFEYRFFPHTTIDNNKNNEYKASRIPQPLGDRVINMIL